MTQIRNNIKISDEDAKRYDELIQQANYYDRIQYVYKIRLNSLYGALLNAFFKFYDMRLGSSTTGTGRIIIKHQSAMVNKLLNDIYDYKGDALVAGDTDSSYFKTYADNKNDAILIADAVGKEVNETFQEFMRETFLLPDGYNNKIQAAREIVASKAIYIKKKMYLGFIINNEGVACEKLKMMGIALKRTTIPKEIAIKLTGFVKKLLSGEDWDETKRDVVAYIEELKKFDTKNVLMLGKPIGVKNMDMYSELYALDNKTNLPGHVAASIFYNKVREEYKDNASPKITSGMKIRVFYLIKNFERFNSIAIPTDIEEIPNWFIQDFKPLVDVNRQIEVLVNKPLRSILDPANLVVPSKQLLMEDDLLSIDGIENKTIKKSKKSKSEPQLLDNDLFNI